jgi:hypothetical protein
MSSCAWSIGDPLKPTRAELPESEKPAPTTATGSRTSTVTLGDQPGLATQWSDEVTTTNQAPTEGNKRPSIPIKEYHPVSPSRVNPESNDFKAPEPLICQPERGETANG